MLQRDDLERFQQAFAEALAKPSRAPSIGAFLETKYGANSTCIEVVMIIEMSSDVSIPTWVDSLPLLDYRVTSVDKRGVSTLERERFWNRVTYSSKGFGFYVSFRNDKTTIDDDHEFSALFSAVLNICGPAVHQLSTDRSDDTDYESPGAYWEGETARSALEQARALFVQNQNQRGWRGFYAFCQRRPVAKQWRAASIFLP